MLKETHSGFGRDSSRGGARLVTQTALATLLTIALPALGRAEAPTGAGAAPRATSADQSASPVAPYPATGQPTSGAALGSSVDCTRPTTPGRPTAISAPVQPEAKLVKKMASQLGARKAGDQDIKGGNAISDDPTPSVTAETAACTAAAAQRYAAIAQQGGWPTPSKPLKHGQGAPQDLASLRNRLTTEGDLPQRDGAAAQAPWDEALAAGLKHYQARMGLRQTGVLDENTLAALNVPAR